MPHPRVGLVPPLQTGYPFLGQPAPTWASTVTPSTGAAAIPRIEHPGAWRIPDYLGPDIFGCGASRLGHNFVAFAQQEGYQREAVGSMPYGSARWPVTGFIPQDSLPPDVLVSDHDVTAARHYLATVRQDWAQLGDALHQLFSPYGLLRGTETQVRWRSAFAVGPKSYSASPMWTQVP